MTTVKTVADRRVVAEQGVVLNQYVGPLNWEHYKIPASGLSNTQLTFANLVTLGTNRLYDSSFQIEYTIEVNLTATGYSGNVDQLERLIAMHPFPLHWVTDQLRCNINGAACMVRPQETLPQRMMYWRQHVLNKTCSFCPHTKCASVVDSSFNIHRFANEYEEYKNYQDTYGKSTSKDVGKPLPCIRFEWNNTTKIARITIREPVLCTPFNQRLDEVYQGPLFNITSIDIVYQLNDLRRMFACNEYTKFDEVARVDNNTIVLDGLNIENRIQSNLEAANMVVNITEAALCFNVASMPNGMTVPRVLQLPYYDNVCYVTAGGMTEASTGEQTFTSGVYTLSQVPTSIYIFVSENQLFRSSITPRGQTVGNVYTKFGNYYESSYSPIRSINITLGNNTQLLTTTSELDRYQMAVANGLEGVTWEEFTRPYLEPYLSGTYSGDYNSGQKGNKCILRLIPGIDLLIPDKRLVGGTDAEQMVFQVRLTADISGVPIKQRDKLCLWIMFEYVGTLTIEPVHASIDMLPLKTLPPIGSVDTIADTTVDSAVGGGEGTNPTGAGLFDLIRRGYNVGKRLWNSGIGKTVRGAIDNVLSDEPPAKGGRIYGGTIIGGNQLGKYIQ